jgi:hypothetical protein
MIILGFLKISQRIRNYEYQRQTNKDRDAMAIFKVLYFRSLSLPEKQKLGILDFHLTCVSPHFPFPRYLCVPSLPISTLPVCPLTSNFHVPSVCSHTSHFHVTCVFPHFPFPLYLCVLSLPISTLPVCPLTSHFHVTCVSPHFPFPRYLCVPSLPLLNHPKNSHVKRILNI